LLLHFGEEMRKGRESIMFLEELLNAFLETKGKVLPLPPCIISGRASAIGGHCTFLIQVLQIYMHNPIDHIVWLQVKGKVYDLHPSSISESLIQ
jgi:hypothetical protein